jgi:hypothetical protein
MQGDDLSQPGCELSGISQTWEAIAMSIEDRDRDPHGFHLIIHTLLAVPGPTSHLSSDWQNNFVELRNQTTWGGDGNRVALLTTVIGLPDARGIVTEGSKGMYDKTWQAIVGRLLA